MNVEVTTAGQVRVCETGNLRSLKIISALPHGEVERLRDVLGALAAEVDAAHAWLSIAALRTAAGHAGDAAWGEAFDGMIETGARHGFVDAAASTVRAHIEWVGEAGAERP